jgi:glutamate dehydrogenase
VLRQLRSQQWLSAIAERQAVFEARGVPTELAAAHAGLSALYHGADIAAVVRDTGASVTAVGRAFFAVGERLDLERLEQQVLALPGASSIHRWAQQALLDDALEARRLISGHALAGSPGADPDAAVDAYLAERKTEHDRLTAVGRALSSEAASDAATIALAIRHLRALAA